MNSISKHISLGAECLLMKTMVAFRILSFRKDGILVDKVYCRCEKMNQLFDIK